jgi:hypothetical protein
MINIPALFKAYQAGQIIANPEKWKSGGELANASAGFVSAAIIVLSYWYPTVLYWMTPDAQAIIAGLIVGVLSLVNIIITRITTTKEIGLKALKDK